MDLVRNLRNEITLPPELAIIRAGSLYVPSKHHSEKKLMFEVPVQKSVNPQTKGGLAPFELHPKVRHAPSQHAKAP